MRDPIAAAILMMEDFCQSEEPKREQFSDDEWGVRVDMLTATIAEFHLAQWTRLSGELPPKDGQVSEVRFDGEPARYVLAWSPACACFCGSKFRPDGEYDEVGWHPDERLVHRTGWWRLLPGGEPPTDV